MIKYKIRFDVCGIELDSKWLGLHDANKIYCSELKTGRLTWRPQVYKRNGLKKGKITLEEFEEEYRVHVFSREF